VKYGYPRIGQAADAMVELGDFSMHVGHTTDSATDSLYRLEPIPAWIKQGNDASALITNGQSASPEANVSVNGYFV